MPRRLALCLSLCGLVSVAAADLDGPRQATVEPPNWEEAAPSFQPLRLASQRELDTLSAEALFAHGRLLYQRRDFAAALRSYQRAYRYDPDSRAILGEIFPLAFNLQRPAEAARYAVIAAEKDPQDPLLLTRLAIYLTQQEEFERARKLYVKAMALLQDEPPSSRTVLLYLELGRLYLLTGDVQKSADCFERVREALQAPDKFHLDTAALNEILGESGRTCQLLAESFLLAGRLDDAQAMFQMADQRQPNPSLLGWRLARVQNARGNPAAALELLQPYLENHLTSEGAGPYRLLAELLEKLDDDRQAARRQLLEQLRRYYDQDPANGELGYFLAEQLRQDEQLEEAQKLFATLLKDRPAAEAYQGLLQIYRRRGDDRQVLELLGQVAQQARSLKPLGDALTELLQDQAAVGRLIELARQQSQGQPPPEHGVPLAAALLAIEANQFDAADELFEAAVHTAQSARPQVLVSWGLEMLIAGQGERAARVFRQTIDENAMPDRHDTIYLQLASALDQAGRLPQAVEAAQKAAKLAPDSHRVQAGVGLILYRAKRYDEAAQHYRQLLEKFDDNRQDQDVRDDLRQARLVLSNICVLQDRPAEAEEWLEQVLDEYPEDIGALNDLSYLWADQGKHLSLALGMAQQALAGEPDNAAYRDTLGWVYYRLGRHAAAVRELRRAAEGDDPDGVILDHLGDAYLQAGQAEQATGAWRKALEALQEPADAERRAALQAKLRQHANTPQADPEAAEAARRPDAAAGQKQRNPPD